MKLDNKGWGAREMIILSAGLLVAFGISMYFISSLYGSFEEATEDSQYFELETKLESAAIRYATDNDLNINGTYKISHGTLKSEGYIDELRDTDDNLCGGYVIISDTSGDTSYEAYISCDNYVTEGY